MVLFGKPTKHNNMQLRSTIQDDSASSQCLAEGKATEVRNQIFIGKIYVQLKGTLWGQAIHQDYKPPEKA